MLYFRTLAVPPDFANPPSIGVTANFSRLSGSPAPSLIRWVEDHEPKERSATFVLRGPLEVRTIRNHVRLHRGAWRPFYMPSWTQDFRSATTVAIGDDAVDIDSNINSFLTGNRPDTYGRTVFFYSPARSLFVARVLATASNGAGGYTLTLDRPFSFAADLSECICGFAWLVRFSGAEFAYQHDAPDRMRLDTSLIEVVNTAATDQELTISGSSIGESKAFVSLIESDDDPNRSDMRSCAFLGPEFYSTAQSENFTHPWAATLAGGIVTLTDGDDSQVSTLYDGTNFVRHISAAFDVLGNEALVWEKDFDTIRLRYFSGVTATGVEWAGRTPILFQNFTINGEISGGEADITAYYLKTGESKLYARIQSESFATERVSANLPVMLLGLIDNNVFDSHHYLRAISTRHTRVQLVSAIYALAFGVQRDEAEATTTVSGDYILSAVTADDAADATTGETTVTGAYLPTVVNDGTEDEASATASATGEYVFAAIDGAEIDSATATVQVTGAYPQTGVPYTAEDGASATATTTGQYIQP